MINTNLKKSHAYLKVTEDIQEYEDSELSRKMTRDETIEYLFGSYFSRGETPLDIYVMDKPETKVIHRLNMIWAFPLTLLCAPYMWIRRGEVGWHNKSRVGRFVLKCVGEDT